jgi:hypothetical protein
MSGGRPRLDDWTDAARSAAATVAAGAQGRVKVRCPGNTLLYLFFW